MSGLGVGDGHSELLDNIKLPLQLLTFELEVWNALVRGVSNELLALHTERLRCPSARYLALAIEFEHNELAGGLSGRSLQLFE